jgi:hypothetical protein
MSTTPRTDAAKVQGADTYNHCYYVSASTASDLERELTETIESEANWKLTAKHHGERARDLECENAAFRAIIDATLSALPVGNVRTHTPDSIPERVGDLVKAHADELAENETLIDENVKANGLLDMQMKELAELRKDKARLDWLDADGEVCDDYRGHYWREWLVSTINTPLKPDASVRAAIDAAMEGEK